MQFLLVKLGANGRQDNVQHYLIIIMYKCTVAVQAIADRLKS